jgi:hypothetical protein
MMFSSREVVGEGDVDGMETSVSESLWRSKDDDAETTLGHTSVSCLSVLELLI